MAANKSFIVVFKDEASEEDYKKHAADIEKAGGKVDKHFGDVLKGFSASIPEDHVSTLQEHPAIAYVEPDSEVKTA